jgi:transposase
MMPQDVLFVGVDVSKRELEISEGAGPKTFTVANTTKSWAKLASRWRGRPLVVGIEPSGGYERGVVRTLLAQGIDVRWAEPRRVRALAQALGAPAKTDPIDAHMIRLYVTHAGGSRVELAPEREALRDLLSARQAAQDSGLRLRLQAKALAQGPAREALERLAQQAEIETKALARQALEAIRQSSSLAQAWRLLQTAPGIGPLVAAELLATMPELGRVNGKAIAKLAGLAPFIRQSGAWNGRAHCSGGRPRPRRSLYLAAMASLRAKNGLRPVYDALVAKGKPRMVALTACMRRLLVTLNAMMTEQSPYRGSAA